MFRVFRGLKKSESGDHGLVLVPENQGTTEQPEYTETRHNRARIPFRVFCVFRGLKKSESGSYRIGPLSLGSQDLYIHRHRSAAFLGCCQEALAGCLHARSSTGC